MKSAGEIHSVSRTEAARFLRITTRSLDRYIRAGKLSAARASNGQVFLDRKELTMFKKGKPLELRITEPFRPHKHEHEPSFYQKLYEQALPLIEEKEKKLEAAQYRIGQLEAQLPNIASFNVKPISQGSHEYDLRRAEETVEKLEQKMKREALNRKILAAILYIVLLLQPMLWYFLRTPPAS